MQLILLIAIAVIIGTAFGVRRNRVMLAELDTKLELLLNKTRDKTNV